MARPGSGVAFVSMLVAPGGTAFRRHTQTVFLDVSVIQQHAAMRRRLSRNTFSSLFSHSRMSRHAHAVLA